jgi:hypothetical protein
MSGIDWSKAPEWADRVIVGRMSSSKYWACDDRRQSIKSVYTYHNNIHLDDKWLVSEWRPSPAWNGDGLPPVGVKCEFEPHNDVWGFSTLEVGECTVIAYHSDFVWLDLGEPGIPVATRVDKIDFRPIRTPEKIAADERNKECDRMYGVILDNVPEDRRKNGSDIVEALYDAGLRFPE